MVNQSFLALATDNTELWNELTFEITGQVSESESSVAQPAKKQKQET